MDALGPLAVPDIADIVQRARHAKAAARRAAREAEEWRAAPTGRRVCLYPEDFIRLGSAPLRCYRCEGQTVLVQIDWPGPVEESRRIGHYVFAKVQPFLREKGLLDFGSVLVAMVCREGGFVAVWPGGFDRARLHTLRDWAAGRAPDQTLCLFDPEAELRWGKHRRAWVAAVAGAS